LIKYRQKTTKVYYINRKDKIYKNRPKIYATSTAGSVAVEGAESSAAGVLEGGTKDLGTKFEEAADGEIRATMLGAYCFTFLKKSNISERGRAWEEPTFSQSITSPCT
jgi:hypothetical protein